jgi:hypothetical protein
MGIFFFLFAVAKKSRIFAIANVDRFVMIATTEWSMTERNNHIYGL